MYRTYVVKVFLVGFGPSGRLVEKIPKTILKAEWRPGAVPQAYDLRAKVEVELAYKYRKTDLIKNG